MIRTTPGRLLLISLLVIIGTFNVSLTAGAEEIKLGRTGLSFSVHPASLQMPLHIASPVEFISKVQILSYKDTTVFRQAGYFENGAPTLNDGFLFSIANALPLFRVHPAGKEDLGIGFQGKWMIPFVTDGSWIAMAMEFVIDLGITASPHPSLAFSVTRKHICSHLLDRSLFTEGTGFLGTASSDVDPQRTPMAIRDSAVFSVHFSPEKLFSPGQKLLTTSLYFDYGYSLPGGDPFSDARYTRPSYRTSQYFQYGAQVTIALTAFKTSLGSIYGGVNFSNYESAGYAVNTALSAGYILPGTVGRSRLAIDLSYYDGRAVMEEYYGHRERYTSIGLKLMR